MKTIIKQDNNNNVTIDFINLWNEKREIINISLAANGEVFYTDSLSQVCERLGRSGDTLYYKGEPENFIDFIRSEYRKMRYDMKSL